MLFNSFEFIFLFLPIAFFIYFYLNKKKLVTASKIFLVLSSLFFYSWWNIIYLPLILISMIFNFKIGKLILENKEREIFTKKRLLTIGIIINISLLGYFKYADFFIKNTNYFFNFEFTELKLALPLAISFFTLQQVAYLIETFRGKIKENSFLNYGVFVTFFPQLISGPIVYHREIMGQFTLIKNKIINTDNISFGLLIFSIGFFKKVVIADTFAVWASDGFDNPEILTFYKSWITTLSYTFQIYFDFSGYTDMALGIALLFNIKLPINFNSPYKATNIQDFWRRWHITLSRFLRDYIYIPLGGSRQSSLKTYSNLILTFIIGGLWHGAGWTFLFWGFLHGIALVVHRIWSVVGFKLNSIISWIITFNFINFTFVFFRAEEWNDATTILNKMLKFRIIEEINLTEVLLIASSFLLVLLFKNSNQLKKSFSIYTGIFIGILFFLSFVLLFLRGEGEFLYFQF